MLLLTNASRHVARLACRAGCIGGLTRDITDISRTDFSGWTISACYARNTCTIRMITDEAQNTIRIGCTNYGLAASASDNQNSDQNTNTDQDHNDDNYHHNDDRFTLLWIHHLDQQKDCSNRIK
jgi:hypothetical protein